MDQKKIEERNELLFPKKHKLFNCQTRLETDAYVTSNRVEKKNEIEKYQSYIQNKNIKLGLLIDNVKTFIDSIRGRVVEIPLYF